MIKMIILLLKVKRSPLIYKSSRRDSIKSNIFSFNYILCYGDSIEVRAWHNTHANLYNWNVYGRGYQDEEQKEVEERTCLYTQRQVSKRAHDKAPLSMQCS